MGNGIAGEPNITCEYEPEDLFFHFSEGGFYNPFVIFCSFYIWIPAECDDPERCKGGMDHPAVAGDQGHQEVACQGPDEPSSFYVLQFLFRPDEIVQGQDPPQVLQRMLQAVGGGLVVVDG